MKPKSLFIIALLFATATQGQSNVKNLSNEGLANYFLANITEVNYSFHKFYKGSFLVNVYTMNDSKATPEGYFEGTDSTLSSVLVSVMPDGYYTQSKLYKIEGLEAPKVVAIKETQHPEFLLVVETGPTDKRATKEYRFEGISKK